ncbi:MAG TPA: amidohydrolase [Tenuifilaceae bacterium]|nr:amidohydrolase [Tenuifilaceae bacterium]HPI45918.1 amidohydrolase [Tenuifilaceae bacterium]HPN20428.1 amidohydrolase [Tenuifilaceae bacterium]HPV57212.1 amidohydrolase [Tenuifilaceae bacterium]
MRVTIIQSGLEWENPNANKINFEKKIKEVAHNSDLILLPEMFTTGFSMNPQGFADLYPGETSAWMSKMATENSIALTGSYIAKENSNYFNRMIFAYPNGDIVYYDKRHLFRMAGEDKNYSAGNKRVVVNYMGWRILLLVCYDLRFPVWSRNRNDYDLILLVANFPERRRYAWNSLLVARAIENQCYVAACNRVGDDGNGVKHFGDSQIIDPLGQPIAIANPNRDEIITATLSLDNLKKIRESFPVHLDADRFEIL